MNTTKESYTNYGLDYQQGQAEKLKNKERNHWKHRINLAKTLVNRYYQDIPESDLKSMVVADIGCSIGTFAIEFAKQGFTAYGIDYDADALKIAGDLAAEQNVSPTFIKSDISDLVNLDIPQIDIAVCFDIFEHLHDDELGALLSFLKPKLAKKGILIFHTYPTEYHYLFYTYPWYKKIPLLLFKNLSKKRYERLVRSYACFLDVFRLMIRGKSRRDDIRNNSHCNPLTIKRLEHILIRSGYMINYIQSSQLYNFHGTIQNTLLHQPISHNNIYGIATIKQ